MEAIKRQVEDESQGELIKKQDVTVEVETVKADVGTVEEKMNDAEDGIVDTERNLSEEHWMIVEQLKGRNWKKEQAMALSLRKSTRRF